MRTMSDRRQERRTRLAMRPHTVQATPSGVRVEGPRRRGRLGLTLRELLTKAMGRASR